jgi:hypothetical protein
MRHPNLEGRWQTYTAEHVCRMLLTRQVSLLGTFLRLVHVHTAITHGNLGPTCHLLQPPNSNIGRTASTSCVAATTRNSRVSAALQKWRELFMNKAMVEQPVSSLMIQVHLNMPLKIATKSQSMPAASIGQCFDWQYGHLLSLHQEKSQQNSACLRHQLPKFLPWHPPSPPQPQLMPAGRDLHMTHQGTWP